MKLLGIETSCDETAAAVVEDGWRILSNVVASQAQLHAKYGGVFPELASRQHLVWILPVIQEALAQAELDWGELDGIGVTYGPGLAGSLLVGVNVAKALALAKELPLVGINHLEGHIYANWLAPEPSSKAPHILFPALCLIISGGHSNLVLMTDHLNYASLGSTLDDAAGEAFDKIARLLGLGYPGGPAIEEAAKEGSPAAFDLPRAWLGDSYDFSFSGLKTAVLREVQRYEKQTRTSQPKSLRKRRGSALPPGLPVEDLAASFQQAVVAVLVGKTKQAAEEYQVETVLLAGGVASNQSLCRQMSEELNTPMFFPPPALCTDNAAMVASAAYFRLERGLKSDWDLDVVTNLNLG